MPKRWPLFALGVLVVLLGSLPASGQGVQTGTLTGLVKSIDGLSLPGVTVTVKSPALQGGRTDVTDVNGVYAIHGLPAGTYAVTFDLSNFQPSTNNDVQVTVGGTAEVNTTMSPATRTETVTVTAESPSPLATVTTGQAITKSEVDALPIGRRPVDIAELAPGLTINTPNRDQCHDLGGLCLRQHHDDQRRRRERQPARVCEQLVHRGCHPGDQRARFRHPRGVRPFLRRGRERHHQERRQQIRRQLPGESQQPEVD